MNFLNGNIGGSSGEVESNDIFGWFFVNKKETISAGESEFQSGKIYKNKIMYDITTCWPAVFPSV
ncbi:MAG TPA: hypothetical protein PKY31_14640 [Spirochaetota bacterium]|nr:hypothetical protein [Spirochaetota bacterium]